MLALKISGFKLFRRINKNAFGELNSEELVFFRKELREIESNFNLP